MTTKELISTARTDTRTATDGWDAAMAANTTTTVRAFSDFTEGWNHAARCNAEAAYVTDAHVWQTRGAGVDLGTHDAHVTTARNAAIDFMAGHAGSQDKRRRTNSFFAMQSLAARCSMELA